MPYGNRDKNYVNRLPVNGEGPVPCDIMFIGEGPGYEEAVSLRPFVGPSGKELNRYIWRALGRMRSSVYVTNLVRFRVPADGDPSPEDVQRDSAALGREIRQVAPSVIVTLGRHSSRHFLGDVDMDTCHGIPHVVRGHVVLPVVHPAAGLHSTEFQALTWWDMGQLGRLMRGEIEPEAREDAHPNPNYLESTVEGGVEAPEIAMDTEGSAKEPWCLTWSVEPGQAVMERKQRVWPNGKIILHNAMHDLSVLRALKVDKFEFHDTMVMAYLLNVEPQGLKALAKRHCGMEMRDYNDLMGNVNEEKAFTWLADLVSRWQNKQSSKGSGESGRTLLKGTKKSTFAPDGKKSKKISRKKRQK